MVINPPPLVAVVCSLLLNICGGIGLGQTSSDAVQSVCKYRVTTWDPLVKAFTAVMLSPNNVSSICGFDGGGLDGGKRCAALPIGVIDFDCKREIFGGVDVVDAGSKLRLHLVVGKEVLS